MNWYTATFASCREGSVDRRELTFHSEREWTPDELTVRASEIDKGVTHVHVLSLVKLDSPPANLRHARCIDSVA